MTSEDSEIDSERYEWVPVRVAANRLNVSEKTVYNRIGSGVLKSTLNNAEGRTEVLMKRGETVENPAEAVQKFSDHYKLKCEELQEEIQTLRGQLQEVLLREAKLQGEVNRLSELERIIQAQGKTIRAHEMASEAMHNERITITTALQKYRNGPESGFKWPWSR